MMETVSIPFFRLPQNTGESKTAGLYIHVPFCRRKCAYCDFYSVTDLDRIDAFLRAVQKEIQLNSGINYLFDTLHFGGGTPSVLSPEQISPIMETALKCFSFSETPEITLEVNPNTVDRARLKGYRSLGVNRLNVGVQSFNDDALSFLGRIHTGAEAAGARSAALEAGFENIGVDVIYGLPDQERRLGKADLQRAVEYAPAHISAYMLSYPENTPIFEAVSAGRIRPLSENKGADLFDLTADFLAGAGYRRYEVSNYARSVWLESRHNRKYWTFAPYLGVGPAAHSYLPPQRRWNVDSLSEYIRRIDTGVSPAGGSERPDREQRMMEAVYLGLRLSSGIDITAFRKEFQIDVKAAFSKGTQTAREKGLIRIDENCIRLTQKGFRFADRVAAMFIESRGLES